MADRKELEKALERINEVLDISAFSPAVSAEIIKNSLRKQIDGITDEEISEFVNTPVMDDETMQKLNEVFEKSISNILTGNYDDFTQKQVVSGIMARSEFSHLDLSEDDVKKFVKKKFKELSHVAELSPYKR